MTLVTEHPVHMRAIDANGMRHALLGDMSKTVKRQGMPPIYWMIGAIYINDAGETTLDTSSNDNEVGLVMLVNRCVDVDDLGDFARAERILVAR